MNVDELRECVVRLFPEAYDGFIKNKHGEQEPVFFISCPGKGLHSTPDKETDTCVRFSDPDLPISITCFHEQCVRERMRMGDALRAMLPDGAVRKTKRKRILTAAEQEIIKAKCTAKGIIASQFPKLFKEPLDDSFFARALWLPESREKYFSLYRPEDTIWNGEKYESGKFGAEHFKTVAQWKLVPVKFLGQLTAPGLYVPGEVSRSNVMSVAYFILEFDNLEPGTHGSKDPQIWRRNQIKSWILVRWLEQMYNLKLRLCVDSGKSSLHFWVEFTSNITPSLQALLRALGADKLLYVPSQPVRFPGVIRRDTHKPQQVIEL